MDRSGHVGPARWAVLNPVGQEGGLGEYLWGYMPRRPAD